MAGSRSRCQRGPLEQARSRTASATFVCADLLWWRPDRSVDAVLSRGVLNDLIDDDQRRDAVHAFASWLAPAGVLLADVRDWDATVARYAGESIFEREVRPAGP